MLRKRFAKALMAAAVLAVAAGAALPAQTPPEINISEMALRTGLSPLDEEQIRRYIKYHVEQMRKAAAQDEVLSARDALVAGFGKYKSIEHRYVYAREAAKLIPPLLELPDKLKQVNAAIALGQMKQVRIQPALDILTAHKNPAARLLGWQSYRSLRLEVMSRGMAATKTMYASLAKAASTEASSLVMRSVFRMLNPPRRTLGVSTEVMDYARKRSFEILRKCWGGPCQRVVDGDAAMADACQDGLRAMRSIAKLVAVKPAEKTSLIQMAMDLAWCSARAYDDAGAKGPTGEANSLLLFACESLLNELTGLNKNYIGSKLRDEKLTPDEKRAAVRMAALDWIDELKRAGYKVEKPQFKPTTSAATTRAATTGPAK